MISGSNNIFENNRCHMIYPPLLWQSPQAIRDILLRGHKQAFVWMDEWYGKYDE